MVVAGIIAEYNPFHKGHQYHIEQTRKMTNADYVIVVMSPDYVQRGAPALLDKHTRTRMALEGGADLVIELPLEYACGSAEYFTMGGVILLDFLNVVNFLSFGSECGEIEPLKKIGSAICRETAEFQDILRAELKKGSSFPVARRIALSREFPEYIDVIDRPNNILAVEYCAALNKYNCSMEPITIKRTADNYHDTNISNTFSSASAIRTTLLNDNKILADVDMTVDDLLDNVEATMPECVFGILKSAWLKNGPLCEDDFSALLKYKLLLETSETLHEYIDVSANLVNKIVKSLNDHQSFSQFAELLKSKDLTRTRINRALLHILLHIKKMPGINYARILGFKRDAQALLGELKKFASIPIITKTAEANYDAFAANLYESVLSDKYNRPFVHEYSKPIVIV